MTAQHSSVSRNWKRWAKELSFGSITQVKATMQRAVRRAAQASKQAKRRAQAITEKDRLMERKTRFQQKAHYERGILDEARRERESRREDWMLGPLAPRRDVGDIRGTYGSVSTARLQFPVVDEKRRRKTVNIVSGDRVCALAGRDKGKIGKVIEVDRERESVTVEGLNIYDVETPSFVLSQESDKRPIRPYTVPLRLEDVRLVVPLMDPETGHAEDVVVENTYSGAPIQEQPYGSSTPKHTRYITGLDVEIPWPEEEPPKFEDELADTMRIDVEHPSYVPELMSFPFPSSVMDELRNKYSKFRTRHEPAYIERKQREDAMREFRNSQTLLTPQSEYLAKKVKETAAEREKLKDEDGNYKMSQNTEKFIDQFMAKKKLPQNPPQIDAKPETKSTPSSPPPIKGRFVPGKERAKRRKAKKIKKP